MTQVSLDPPEGLGAQLLGLALGRSIYLASPYSMDSVSGALWGEEEFITSGN